MSKRFHLVLAILLATSSMYTCNNYQALRKSYTNANALLYAKEKSHKHLFLKAHMKNGDVFIFEDKWEIDTTSRQIQGKGVRYDLNREQIAAGAISVPIDSVVIFETNRNFPDPDTLIAPTLTLLFIGNAIITFSCLSNPKACFGSCPTFYLNESSNLHYADAEGFSQAICPSLEAQDIDALNTTVCGEETFLLTMKNEALETHCVKDVKLLAYPRKNNERIFHTANDDFYLCHTIYPLTHAYGQEGEITKLLAKADHTERSSLANEENINSKEEIFLTFDNVEKQDQLGLILSFRQTLMTTYFFYETLDYMGDQAGNFLAFMEREAQKKKERVENLLENSIKRELGNIEIYLWDEQQKNWIHQGALYELGPIAVNTQITPLSAKAFGESIKIKLVMTEGLWRLDYAALAGISQKIEPLEVKPDSISNHGNSDQNAWAKIQNPNEYLITMPGDVYQFHFTMPKSPANTEWELFLYSQGYYWEWIRAQWAQDNNLPKLYELLLNPKKYLQEETPKYKQYEQEMEQIFWNSRIDADAMLSLDQ